MELVRLGADAAGVLVDGALAVREAARAADHPWHPAQTRSFFEATLRHGWDGSPSEWTVALAGGRVVGVLEVGVPRWDNHHLGFVDVVVDPEHRRRGIGRALAEDGMAQVRATGRTTLFAEALDLPASEPFCRALGLDRVYRDAERRLHLVRPDRGRMAALRQEAAERAAGYELLRLAGDVPDDLLEQVVALTAVINDAPTGEADVEDEVYSAERVRAFERAQAAHGRRLYRLVARERATGEPAGHTVVAVDGERPWYADQLDTSVARAHRGHRLGLLLKTEMLGWLADAEPQLRVVDTWNALDNAHMIAVNEVLGCVVTGTSSGWQRSLVDPPPVTRPAEGVAPVRS